MKRKLLIALTSIALIFTFGCSNNDKKTQTSDEKSKTEATTENKETDDKSQQSETEKNQAKVEKSPIFQENNNITNEKQSLAGIYYKEANPIVFSDTITNDDVKSYLQKNNSPIINQVTQPLTIFTENGKIVDVKIAPSITVDGKYVGLVDNTTAEFETGQKTFRLNITDEQMNTLENLNENQLLSLNIVSPKDNSNALLYSFTQK